MPRALPRNGLIVDIGSGPGRWSRCAPTSTRCPVEDRTDDPWASTVQGVAHACGHDVHATALLGRRAGARRASPTELPGRVRLIFQPAEEIMPGGALMADRGRCPRRRLPDLRPALRPQPRRRHGRPARGPAHRRRRRARRPAHGQGRAHLAPAPDRGPHLRARQAGHRAARASSRAGSTPAPASAWSGAWSGPGRRTTSSRPPAARGGTVRMLDAVAWVDAEELVRDTDRARSSSRTAWSPTVTYVRGVPPVVNEHRSTVLLGRAVERGARRGGPRAHHAEPRRRGLRRGTSTSVPGAMGAARHAHARRPDVRPPPGRPARRRAGHRRSAPGCSPPPRSRDRWSPTR